MIVLFNNNNIFKDWISNEHLISLIAAFEEKISLINLEQNAGTVFVDCNNKSDKI